MKLLSNIYKERLPLAIVATILTSIYYLTILPGSTLHPIASLMPAILSGGLLGHLLHMTETNHNL